MKVTIDCVPCYLVQCKNALLKTKTSEKEQFEILHKLLQMLPGLDPKNTPAENSTVVLNQLVHELGGKDPYREAKIESNNKALSYYDKLEDLIFNSADKLFTALKIAVAGNVIDLGIFQDYDIGAAIKEVLDKDFAINDYSDFHQLLKNADSILIIGDNSGEIVFDKLLLKELKKDLTNLVYGVKNSFIINDATTEDAMAVGIDRLARVVTNGNNYLGTVERFCSPEFLSVMQKADLIISKGQANYETLEGTELAGHKTFFLLKAKCPVVAKNLGVELNDIVFARNDFKANLA